jgi:hypothetical protein
MVRSQVVLLIQIVRNVGGFVFALCLALEQSEGINPNARLIIMKHTNSRCQGMKSALGDSYKCSHLPRIALAPI